MHTKMNNDFDYIQASLNTQQDDDNPFKDHDPFNKSWIKILNVEQVEI